MSEQPQEWTHKGALVFCGDLLQFEAYDEAQAYNAEVRHNAALAAEREPILPVHVLAEPLTDEGEGPSQPLVSVAKRSLPVCGEARESNNASAEPTEGKPEPLASDSRGGQNTLIKGLKGAILALRTRYKPERTK